MYTYVPSITPTAHTCMYRRRMCGATAWRATHTEIRGHKCRWDFADAVGESLSSSIRRETYERTIRTLFEMNFIRAARSRDDTRVNTYRKECFNSY